MTKKNMLLTTITTVLLLSASLSNAALFYKTGTIKRSLASSETYGGCMVQLDVNIGGENSCPNSGWVSLDCDANHLSAKAGERMYSSAMVAASLKQKVTLLIDDTKKNNNYCVATRLDVVF